MFCFITPMHLKFFLYKRVSLFVGLWTLAFSPNLYALDFNSSDSTLVHTFRWARDMALSYVHDGSDSVGLWYEAALPGRESFCMRDLSHQVVGASLLGLGDYNLNMLASVASNISESKDWCSYWETDRHGRPTSCDYANDKEFWYNLPANFDLLRACYQAYEWTGDVSYLRSSVFDNFYWHTAHDYADRWALTPDSIMQRRRFMNTPLPFNRKNAFHTCRGLPSYAENFSGITVAVDLLGALKCGYQAYAAIAQANGCPDEAFFAVSRAQAYDSIIENRWWDDNTSRYYTYFKEDGSFHRGEGLPYMLLIGALNRPDRVEATLDDVLSRSWNVENLSAFPLFLYRNGRRQAADSIINSLPDNPRSDYPEVSFGVLEGIFSGLMGIQPAASRFEVFTCHNGASEAISTADGVSVMGGSISVTHVGHTSSTLTNDTPHTLHWIASFRHDDTIVRRTVALPPGATATLSRE